MGIDAADLRHTHSLGHDTAERYVVRGACPPLVATPILLAGLTDAGRGYCMIRVGPTFEQLVVCVGGQGQVLVEGSWRPCRAGQAYLCPLGANHAFHTVGARRWQFCWILYNPPGQGGASARRVIGGSEPRLVDVDPRGLWSAIEGCHQEASGPAEPVMLERYVDMILAHSARIIDPHHDRDPLWHLWAAVTTDLSADWSLERLAEVACFSISHVRRLCLKQTGRTPVEQLTHLRMTRAAAMLESTPMKVGAVARAVGYANAFAFSTAFRRARGVSPDQWRKEHLAKVLGQVAHGRAASSMAR